MYYVEVLIAEASYHGHEALTYATATEVERGNLVLVPLRAKLVLGVVSAIVPAPSFKTKTVHSVLLHLPKLPKESLELLEWMRAYYPSPLGVITQLFLPKQLPKKPVDIAAPAAYTAPPLPPLTTEQQAVVWQIKEAGTYVLHGDTGTGKTRVYIELSRQSLAQGRSVIILTPEIGLTSQLERDFRHVFGERVVVVHSQLTEVTRQRLWVSLLQQTEPVIIIGPRSALFSPLRKIGFIAVDEAHEAAYKQDQAPYYHASRVASRLAELHDAPLILGSATPLVTDFFLAKAKKRPVLRMQHTAKVSHESSVVRIVDIRNKSNFAKKSHLSDELIQSITDTLARNEQTLLFLNRRGTARIVFCEDCGWQALCPHCDVPLVYHGDSHIMRCHTCDFKSTSPTSCATCKGVNIVFRSIGTKAIVEEVARLFPEAQVQRFDTDNKKAERIEQHYESIRAGKVDIIIGTQTLAKGLDLPHLSLVGVLVADTSLFFPDFGAQERTYQLLSQVIGRVGRGHRAGAAIIQTFSPDSKLLRAVTKKDWDTFYATELAERRQFLFPPFCYLLKLTCRRATQTSAIKAAEVLAGTLRSKKLRIIIEGPAPAFHEKVLNKYQWQLIIKAKDRSLLMHVLGELPSGWSYDIDPMNLL